MVLNQWRYRLVPVFMPALILDLVLGLVFGLAPANAFSATEKVLNINNWAEYIGENTVKNFEKEAGIKVR